MTIGLMNHDLNKGKNPNFLNMLEYKKLICDRFNLNEKDVNLSMGMTNDFEHAVSLKWNYKTMTFFKQFFHLRSNLEVAVYE